MQYFPTRRALVPSLALLALGLISCEDNAAPDSVWQPAIQSVQLPTVVADNAPAPYLIRVETNPPTNPADATGLAVHLELSGPGLSAPAIWTLMDDGGQPLAAGQAGVLQDPGSSGDNIPGDGVFSAQGLADLANTIGVDFSDSPGSYQLVAVLSRDGSELQRSTRTLSVGHNGRPLIQSTSLPTSLASGDSLDAHIILSDPEGNDDLQSVWLELAGQPERRWTLDMVNDSTWSRRLGPEVGARTSGPSLYRLGATDLFGQESFEELSVDVQNLPPVLTSGSLHVWQTVEGDLQPVDFADTLKLVIPLPGQSRQVVFRAIPGDPQGVADILAVSLSSPILSGEPLQLLDDGVSPDLLAGDGEYSGSLTLGPQDEPPAGQNLQLQVTPWLSQAPVLLQLPLALIPERDNAAPHVDQVFVPDTLASGQFLRVEAEFSDPDGASDLTSAWVKFLDTGERWFMQRSGTRWGVDLPEALITFRESNDYGFRVVVSDLFSARDSSDVSVYMVNGEPRLDEEMLAFYRVINGSGFLLDVQDTLFLEIPAVGDTNFFVFTLPVQDDQGALEIERVDWTIEPLDGSSVTTFPMYDDGGSNIESADQTAADGIYTGAMQLIGQASYNNLIYFVDFTAQDLLGNEATPIHRIYKLVDEEQPGPLRPPTDRPVLSRVNSRTAHDPFGGAR
ncbi:MAG: hypothetical protein KDC10_03825 [Calditrichaeota bacterium]|nr:hypothetical protein [Candidatus Cloacimonadota bacterium]MCB1046308.1 hypothetical protein [Calditrichota bacterium]